MTNKGTKVALSSEAQTKAYSQSSEASESSGQQYCLRLWIGEALYRKLVQAHQQVRQGDGTRAGLSEILDRAMDALLCPNGLARRPEVAPSEEHLDDEPETVRAPTTERWHPSREN